MSRVLRMIVLLVVATLITSHTHLNAILIVVVALTSEKLSISDFFILWVASLFMDHAGVLPLAISFLPLVLMYSLLHILKSQIYVQTFMSRLSWSIAAVLLFATLWTLLLTIRGGAAAYLWMGLLRQLPLLALSGGLAAILSPALHYYLNITWEELTRPRRIVVP